MNTVNVDGQLVTPSKVVCIGRNYVAHIEELGNEVPEEMVVFLKPNSAIAEQLSAFHQEPLHYESELCFIYQNGKFSAVGFGLDLTKRALQSQLKAKGLPWERAKAFDGAAVFSDFVSMEKTHGELSLELHINDVLTQQASEALMIYSPDVILEQLQSFISLSDGDIVMTGTPKGVGELTKGAIYTGRVLNGDNELLKQTWQAQ